MNDFEPKDGIFAIPMSKNAIRYNIADLFEYCDQNDIEPSELDPEIKKQFELKGEN